jgi:hypothetical protein
MGIIMTEDEKRRIANREATFDQIIAERREKGEDHRVASIPQGNTNKSKVPQEYTDICAKIKACSVRATELVNENRDLRNKVTANVNDKRNNHELWAKLREEKKTIKKKYGLGTGND